MTKGIRNIKRALAVLLSASMIFGMTPFSASAEESVSGNDSVNETILEEDTASGNNDVSTAESTNATTGDESASVYELTEKDGAYYDTQGIKYTLSTENGENTATVSGYGSNIASEITIPAKVKLGETVYTVTTIGDRAFDTCTNLTKVNFTSDSLTTIEDYVFRKTNLESIKIPKNVTSIGEAICAQCTQLTSIKVDSENKVFNTGLEENVNCIVSGNTLLQGCSTSKVPGTVTEIGRHAFTRMDIRNVNFSDCSKLYISEAGFSLSTMPEDWKIPESFWVIQCLYGITTLKKVTLHDDLFLQPCTSFNSIFPGCSNIEKAVIPASIGYDSGWTNNIDMFGDGGAAENLTVYVGDFTDDNALYQSLKAHAYEDYTGNEVVKYDKDKTRHYILKKAYKVQFDKEYAGYTLAKAKGCTTLTPIPGDSVKFVINVADNYKKGVKVSVIDNNSGNKTILTPDEAGVYTLNDVNENNYKICLEDYGTCDHSNNTYTLENSTITKVCKDCGGNVEIGNVTAVWRHTPYTSVAFSCDNANIKGTFAITKPITSGNNEYPYKFTPSDGSCNESEQFITVSSVTENMEDTTTNGITYFTIQSEEKIDTKLGNCTADIYYDSNDKVLHIDGSETYVLSGKSTTDRIVVNNTEPTTLVLNGLDIQMTNLPAIDLQGTADVKIVLRDKTENMLTASGDYAALQKNDLAESTPTLSIYGPGKLTVQATEYGAAIGAEKNKYASNIKFTNAQITAVSNKGSAIGNGYGAELDNSKLDTNNFIISGGLVRATVNGDYSYDISGRVTVKDDAVVYGVVWGSVNITKLKKYTIIDGSGFISRREFMGDSYSKCQGNIIVDDIFSCNDLEIPEGSTLTVGSNHGQMLLDDGKKMINNGTFIIKGTENRFTGTIVNNGTIYNYEKYGTSIKDKIKTGILHEDVDHDGNCEICGQDIGNIKDITIPPENGSTTIKQNGDFTFSATVTPKDIVSDKTITYQWYKEDADGIYREISGATENKYEEKNSTLAVGTHNYRLEAICDGIIRYIPFTVTVKEPVKYDTHSLTLADEIGVNFFMNIPEYARTEGAYMEFSISGRGGKTTKVKLSDITAETDGRYKFTCPVSAVQMAETITATYHYGENETAENTYSVKQYVEAVVASDAAECAAVKDLIKALADYGYYAQLCLSATNGWTIGADDGYAEMIHYTDNINTNVHLDEFAYSRTGEISGITSINRSLTLDSKTAINIYFTVDKGMDFSCNVTNKYGMDVYFEYTLIDNGTRWRVTIPGIYASELGDTYTINVMDEIWIKTSALSYADTVLGMEGTENENENVMYNKNAMAAMYQYYKAAIAYKNAGSSN